MMGVVYVYPFTGGVLDGGGGVLGVTGIFGVV